MRSFWSRKIEFDRNPPKLYPDKVSLCVSHTSRKPREGEINGTHYHFVSRDQMETTIKSQSGAFLETAEVHGNLYGTSMEAVRVAQASKRICLLDVDMKGVLEFQKHKKLQASWI